MTTTTIKGITAVAACLLLAASAGAQQKECNHHCRRTLEEQNANVVRPHIHGPMIFRNSRYDNSYKHRNFRHQRSAFKNDWERRGSAHCQEH